MNIFCPEYAIFLVFIVIAAWRILKDVPDSEERKRRQRLARDAGMPGADRKSAKRKEKKIFS